MLLKKIYDEETHTQKAWYDSSMFYYTRMVEYENENKGDLYVTFKNGATYKYIGVTFEDYLVLVMGGTDASQGKTLNKVIKSKYDFERVEDVSIPLLEEEYQKACEVVDEKWRTYFISGHREISDEEFENNYKPMILHVLDTVPDCKFVIGDYWGCDQMAQSFLLDTLQISPERVTVYHMLTTPRYFNSKVIKFKGGYQSDEERDEAMTKASTDDIAFVRDHTKISGTGQNILRRHKLN